MGNTDHVGVAGLIMRNLIDVQLFSIEWMRLIHTCTTGIVLKLYMSFTLFIYGNCHA